MRPGHRASLILGVVPHTRGFAWIAFDAPFNAHDWNLVYARGDRNARCLKEFERLLDRLEPNLVVMESPSDRVFRSNRMSALHQSFRAAVDKRVIELGLYSRNDVHTCFASVGARTKQEIAEAVNRQVQGLGHKLPTKRAAWESEDRRISLFDAAALVITHFHIGGMTFLRSLRDDD